ncbi:MAG: FGGY family carbohydrate kinase, partial [Acidimicrobiales bacterium]
MTATTQVAAVDLGAESGRVACVSFDGERLDLDVVHRFTHTPRAIEGVLRWDMDLLWGGVREGLGILSSSHDPVASVGVDAWGVDYGLIDRSGALVDEPTCYRDARLPRQHDRALATLGAGRLYSATGVQILPINTVFGVLSDAQTMPERLQRATTLLMMPDVFHHLLSATRVTEYTA